MTQNWRLLSQTMAAHMGLVCVSYIKCSMGQKRQYPTHLEPFFRSKSFILRLKKKALVIIFAVTKFHRYLHVRFITLQTDHKTLITIFASKKCLLIYTANRLLRWGTILLNYNFKIEYLPSKQIRLADGLSRLVPKYREPFEDTIIVALRTDCEIKNMIANTIKELPVTLLEIKSEAMNKDFITNIKQKITAKNEKVPAVFSLCDNVLLYSERVVIPKKLQNRNLRDFHTRYLGIDKMMSLMRSYVYWPKIDNNIRDMIEKCKVCVLAAKVPPLLSNLGQKQINFGRRIPVDSVGPLEDFYHLIVVDTYSKWPEVPRCWRPTTGATIGFLHELFVRFGVVNCVVSDNGS